METILTQVAMDRIALFRKRAPLIITLVSEAFRHPRILEVMRGQVAPQIFELLEVLFEPGLTSGELRAIDPGLLGRSFMSLILGYLVLGELDPAGFGRGNDEEEAKNIVGLFLFGAAQRATSEPVRSAKKTQPRNPSPRHKRTDKR